MENKRRLKFMSENIGKIFIKKFCTNNAQTVVTSSTIQSNCIDRFEPIDITNQ